MLQSFKPLHFFLFATSALLLARTVNNLYLELGCYVFALVLYILALIKFNKEKK
jgi:hypothetical protein